MKDRSGCLADMREAFEEARDPNWDGYSAAPACHQSFVLAHEFVNMLPDDIPDPDCGVLPNGNMGLEWIFGQRARIILTLDKNRSVTYAAIIGEDNKHGICMLGDSIPETITSIFNAFLGERHG